MSSPTRTNLAILLVTAVLTTSCFESPSDIVSIPQPTGQRIAGRVVGMDGSPAGGVAVQLRWGGMVADGTSGADGSFEARLPATAPVGTGILIVEPAPTPLHPAWIRVTDADTVSALTIVLLPTRWTIESGTFGGTTVDVDPTGAADARVLPSFWGFLYPFQQDGFLQTVVDSTRWIGQLTTWPGAAFPVPVALDRPRSTDPLGEADSLALWGSIDRLEEVLGRDLFRPAALEELTVDSMGGGLLAPGAVLVRVDSAQATRGLGAGIPETLLWRRSEDVAEWSGSPVREMTVISGDISTGRISVREPALLGDARIVPHELMHVLGVGHGCTWASVQSYCSSLASDLPTAEDVAHLEVLMEARWAEATFDADHGVLAGVFGHRVVRRGLSPIPRANVLFGPDNTLVAPLDWVPSMEGIR